MLPVHNTFQKRTHGIKNHKDGVNGIQDVHHRLRLLIVIKSHHSHVRYYHHKYHDFESERERYKRLEDIVKFCNRGL